MKASGTSTENHAPCQMKSEANLERRLTTYGVMSLAIAAATAGGTQPAYASALQPPLSTATSGQVFFSMGGRADTNLFSGADFGLIRDTSHAFLAGFAGRAFLAATNGVRLPAPLLAGVQIGTAGQVLGIGPGGLKFVTAQQTLASISGAGLWFPPSQRDQPQFLGLRFDINGSPHYGWAEIKVRTDVFVSRVQRAVNIGL